MRQMTKSIIRELKNVNNRRAIYIYIIYNKYIIIINIYNIYNKEQYIYNNRRTIEKQRK